MLDWICLLYVIAMGACVGSFLNVVVYRLPLGRSLISPPSSCPKCSHQLAWHDNVPVLGWLWLRGKCRYCRNPISVQYPLVEALTGAIFGVAYILYYFLGWGGGGFRDIGIGETWIVLAMHLILLAGLLAATMIDARLFIIPLQIPWFVTVAAAVLLPASAAIYPITASVVPGEWVWFMPFTGWLLPLADGGLMGLALGGMVGLVIAVVLLQARVLPLSFADDPAAHDKPAGESETTSAADQPVTDSQQPEGLTRMTQEEQDQYLAYPHVRREMFKELLFLSFPVIGMFVGAWLWFALEDSRQMDAPVWAQAMAGVLLGYLVGGGIVWAIRIFGSLLFGKEAMGLGDVHLLAAVGAVLGAKEVTVLFFIAPFFGLVYALAAGLLEKVTRWKWRMIPYGPFLAAASVLMMFAREPVLRYLGIW